MKETDPLKDICFLTLNAADKRKIGDFELDPSIPLPVERTTEQGTFKIEEISWEAILAAMLKILAHNPDHEHAAYYRRFILTVRPLIKEELTEAAVFKARNREHELAIEVFRSLEGLFPDCERTKLNLALAYDDCARNHARRDELEKAGYFEELAFSAYKRALELNPEEPQIHYGIAHFYLNQKSFAKAREHFAAFLRLGKSNKKRLEAERIVKEIDSWGERERLFKESYDFIKLGREGEAVERMQQFLAIHPDVWNGWFLLGWAHRRLGEYERGCDAFKKALALNGDHVDTMNELAICLLELGRLEEGYSHLASALKREPENTKVISNLGVLCLKRGDRAEASRFFQTVLAFDPEDPIARRYLKELQPDS